MNHCLELNSHRLNQSFVLEKANQLILWNFPPVSENPESGPMPGCEGSGGNHPLSPLLCSCLAISFHLVKHCFTRSASQARHAATSSLPAWEATNLSLVSHKISQRVEPYNALPLIHVFIHSFNKHYRVTSMYQPLYLRRSHQGKWS